MFKKAEIEIYDLDLNEDIITVSGDPTENGDGDDIYPFQLTSESQIYIHGIAMEIYNTSH